MIPDDVRELLEMTATQLGLDGPESDQYRAAVLDTYRSARIPPTATVIRVGVDLTPPALMKWCWAHYEELAGQTLRKCGHGGMAQVHTIYADEPNIARCDRCHAVRAVEIVAEEQRHSARLAAAQKPKTREEMRALLVQATRMDCHFCGLSRDTLRLRGVALVIPTFLVLGWACRTCLGGG